MSGGHEGQSRKVKEGQQHFFSVFFSARGDFRPACGGFRPAVR